MESSKEFINNTFFKKAMLNGELVGWSILAEHVQNFIKIFNKETNTNRKGRQL